MKSYLTLITSTFAAILVVGNRVIIGDPDIISYISNS